MKIPSSTTAFTHLVAFWIGVVAVSIGGSKPSPVPDPEPPLIITTAEEAGQKGIFEFRVKFADSLRSLDVASLKTWDELQPMLKKSLDNAGAELIDPLFEELVKIDTDEEKIHTDKLAEVLTDFAEGVKHTRE